MTPKDYRDKFFRDHPSFTTLDEARLVRMADFVPPKHDECAQEWLDRLFNAYSAARGEAR